MRQVDDPLIEDLRKVRSGDAGRQKIVKQLKAEAERAKEPGCVSRLLCPATMHALESNVYVRWMMADQLVLSYSMLKRDQLASCICAAFVSHPAEALLGAVNLAVVAERTADRLHTSEPLLSNNCWELTDGVQQAVAGLLWVLSHQDMHVLDEMRIGATVWHSSRGEGVVVDHLFHPPRICVEFVSDGKVSRYAKHSWDKLTTKRPAYAEELATAALTSVRSSSSGPTDRGSFRRQASAAASSFLKTTQDTMKSVTRRMDRQWSFQEAKEQWNVANDDLLHLLDTALGQRLLDDSIRGELITVIALPELQAALRKKWYGVAPTSPMLPIPNLAAYLSQYALASHARGVALKFLVLPLVAVYPPLEHFAFGATAGDANSGVRPLVYSPLFKWILHQLSYIGFVLALTITKLPVSASSPGFEPHRPRDAYLLLHAVAGLIAELSEMNSVELYLKDGLNVFIELPARALTVAALLINVIGGADTEDLHVATAGKELFAIALALQWMRLLRLLQLTERFGSVVLMLIRMMSDILGFFVIFLVFLLAFTSGFFALYKDPEAHANYDLLADMAPCSDMDELFNSWGTGVITLMEAMLSQDGDSHCYRATSQPVIGTVLMYAFMLTGVLMMVNMLIATMAKTFDVCRRRGARTFARIALKESAA